jgi:hypothetical protein
MCILLHGLLEPIDHDLCWLPSIEIDRENQQPNVKKRRKSKTARMGSLTKKHGSVHGENSVVIKMFVTRIDCSIFCILVVKPIGFLFSNWLRYINPKIVGAIP